MPPSSPLNIDFRTSTHRTPRCKISPFDKFLVDPLGEENKKCESTEPDNQYFNLGITLPKPETKPLEPLVQRRAERWGFLELFQRTQGRDLCKGNPWLSKETAEEKRLEISKRRKTVRFSLTEISPPHYPHCRREDLNQKFGHLHSDKCKNSASEKSSGSDDSEWKNRAFMLETCTKKYTSSAEFYLIDSPIELPVMDFTMKDPSEETDFILGDEFILGDKKSRCMDSIEVRKQQINLDLDPEQGPASKPRTSSPPQVLISPDMISTMLDSEDEEDFLKHSIDYKSCDSAYESSDTRHSEDSDSDDDFDIADLITTNKPVAKMWFNNPNAKACVEPVSVRIDNNTTPTPNVYLNPFSSKPVSAKVSVLVKPSVLGKLVCNKHISGTVRVVVPVQQSEFLFDSMSPDDIVRSKQSVVFK